MKQNLCLSLKANCFLLLREVALFCREKWHSFTGRSIPLLLWEVALFCREKWSYFAGRSGPLLLGRSGPLLLGRSGPLLLGRSSPLLLWEVALFCWEEVTPIFPGEVAHFALRRNNSCNSLPWCQKYDTSHIPGRSDPF